MKTNYLYLIIGILVVILLLQRCGEGPVYIPKYTKIDSVIIHDTIKMHDTVELKPRLVYQKGDTSWIHDTLYKPSGDYNKLLDQYDSLGDKYFFKRTYNTPFKLGKYGSAVITDTIVANQLLASSIIYDINIPTSRTIVTIHDPAKPTRQIYLGGGLFGSQMTGISGAFVGGVYKDRQDRMFGISAGYSNNRINFGISSYWKIKLK